MNPAPKVWKVMPLGDSNTRGKAGHSYRASLKKLLKADGILIDFTGTSISVAGPHGPGHDIDTPYTQAQIDALESDLEHDGRGGYRIDQINEHAPALIAACAPEILLLMIGSNDIDQNYDLAVAPRRFETLCATIIKNAPDSYLYIATIPPCIKNKNDPVRVSEFNDEILKVVKSLQKKHKGIFQADVYGALSTDDLLADGIHLNAQGFEKIGKAWHNAIVNSSILKKT